MMLWARKFEHRKDENERSSVILDMDGYIEVRTVNRCIPWTFRSDTAAGYRFSLKYSRSISPGASRNGSG